MIHIEFEEPALDDKWKEKAEEAKHQLIEKAQNGQPLEFNEKIWGELKSFLIVLFHGKCAYCEVKNIGGSYMDVDHYRPKAKVTHDNKGNNIVEITDAEGNKKPHPGYYWLAYNPRNLILACEKCNRGKGKRSAFPISGKRACCPEDLLHEEKSLLLNPYDEENPQDHFEVTNVSGFLKGITEEGRKTIEICNLNREELQECRREELEFTIEILDEKLNAIDQSNPESIDFDKFIPKQHQFSTYLLKGILKFIEDSGAFNTTY